MVENKCDLAGLPPGREEKAGRVHLRLSAKLGRGIELLHDELLRVAGWQGHGEDVVMARERHLAALSEAATALERAAHTLARPELFAEELRLAQASQHQCTGHAKKHFFHFLYSLFV